jgi:general secretion pathway protein N
VKLRRSQAAGVASTADAQRWQRGLRASRRWAVWGLALGGLAGLAANAPAQWLADALRQASAEHLLLAEARGSLWDGSAVLVLTGGAGSRDAAALPGRLRWQLRPGWRGLQLVLMQACCLVGELRLALQPGWSGYTLQLGDGAPPPGAAPGAAPAGERPLGSWPASWLTGLGTPWNTLQLGGQMQLASPGLRLQSVQGRLRLDGRLVLELHQVSSRLSPLPTLGSYRLGVTGQAAGSEAATLQLDTLEGALRLAGNGQWTGAGLRFRGQARAADDQAAALTNLLNIIGRRQGALSVISIG